MIVFFAFKSRFKFQNQGYKSPLTGENLGENDMLIEELQSKVINEKNGRPEDGNDHCIDAFKYATYRLQEKGLI